MLAEVWIPIEGLMFIVTGYDIDCLAAVTCDQLPLWSSAATPISATETDTISSARLSITQSLDYPRPFTGIGANILFISTQVLSSGGTRTPLQSPPGQSVNSSPQGKDMFHVKCSYSDPLKVFASKKSEVMKKFLFVIEQQELQDFCNAFSGNKITPQLFRLHSQF